MKKAVAMNCLRRFTPCLLSYVLIFRELPCLVCYILISCPWTEVWQNPSIIRVTVHICAGVNQGSLYLPLDAVRMIKSGEHNKSKYAFLIREIVSSMGERDSCIIHIRRSCNSASHSMADFDRLQRRTAVWLDSGPDEVLEIFGRDCNLEFWVMQEFIRKKIGRATGLPCVRQAAVVCREQSNWPGHLQFDQKNVR